MNSTVLLEALQEVTSDMLVAAQQRDEQSLLELATQQQQLLATLQQMPAASQDETAQSQLQQVLQLHQLALALAETFRGEVMNELHQLKKTAHAERAYLDHSGE